MARCATRSVSTSRELLRMAASQSVTIEQPDKPLLDRVHERTARRVLHASRGPTYNIPTRWYMKTNGDIVKLQADPANRAMYEDKGYALLRPDEVQEWEATVRKQVIKEQRKKASLINTIRRIGAKNPGIEIGLNDEMETPELEDILNQVGKATGSPTGVFIGRMKDEPEYDDDADPEAAGVEVGASKEAFEHKLRRAAETGRHIGPVPASRGEPHTLVQGTGYDPTTGRAMKS